MASENVDFVREIYEPWARGDFGSSEWADPEIEFVYADGPTPGRFRGLEEMARAWGETLRAFEDFTAAPEAVRDLDDERVLVLTRNTGRGRTSGVDVADVHRNGANVFHIRDGRVVKLVAYFSRDRALADLERGQLP